MSGLTDDEPSEILEPVPVRARRAWKILQEAGKFSAVLAIMGIACHMLLKKLERYSWEQILEGVRSIPGERIALAALLTILNFIILAGYDLIAVKYLRKQVSLNKVMTGAIVGYAMSNMFGWILGGTASRYRLYSSWGFNIKEIVAFVSILSMTFWLGMFLLAGVAFVALPVHLPRWVNEDLPLSLPSLGYLFLTAVALYLAACALWRKPIRWGDESFALPPIHLSACQLLVSACDFALASAVLFVLLPADLTNFSTVLVTYLAAMIVVVTVHVPGGFGILENITLDLLTPKNAEGVEHPLMPAVVSALVAYRVIYYFCPAFVAGLLMLYNEARVRWQTARERKWKDEAATQTRLTTGPRAKQLPVANEMSDTDSADGPAADAPRPIATETYCVPASASSASAALDDSAPGAS